MTTIMTMEPGDVVFTGTPSGVGVAGSPPRGLHDGDVDEVEIEGIGRLRNQFTVDEPR
jgi:2-keto-4-pentenoate hydratase/2-oxohepta-3-ene-1,7-dioic acid hydratase in catechol pathway